ncbi:arylesterase [Cardiobacterium sp. AH-315-I02]|nr:arylesterase [Cardiobacterium sp. AH-315-I02]
MMKKNIYLVIVSVLTIMMAAVIASCSEKPHKALNQDAVILAFGDSLTYGTGTSSNNAYPVILQTLVHRKVINAGVPGEISKDGLTRLPFLIKQHQPELIIICHGGNDILRRLDKEQTKNNIQKMINLAKDNNSQIILIAVPEFGLFLDDAAFYRTLADKNQIPIASNILGDILGKNTLKSDHIHPNAKGYQILATKIALFLKQTGAIPED